MLESIRIARTVFVQCRAEEPVFPRLPGDIFDVEKPTDESDAKQLDLYVNRMSVTNITHNVLLLSVQNTVINACRMCL